MKKTMSLFDLPINENAVIVSINCKPRLKKRLEAMGIYDGSVITPLMKSPFGDPRAYGVNNTAIAIRSRDAKKIEVEPGVCNE